MRHGTRSRHVAASTVMALVATGFAVTLAGCGASDGPGGAAAAPSASSTGQGTDPTETDLSLAVPGFQVGEIPPVPLFVLPDLSLMSSRNDAFTSKFANINNDYPGLTVSPVACDASGARISSDGAVLAYGDGSVSYVSPDGTAVSWGDGSGSYVDSAHGIYMTNNGDGSGSYVDSGNGVSISNDGDGSGSYVDREVTISIGGDGSGSYDGGGVSITVNRDGSGSYTEESGGITITNNGDGSGSYSGGGLSITNDGHGTATVVGGTGSVEVAADPLPKVPALGKFPPMAALTPQESCGVSITLDAGLLFDFGKSDIRPDAAAVISTVAQALKDNGVPAATVEGHTDSISSDAFNQTLSENRADAVAAALRAAGVTTDLTAVGYGKTRSVAPNTNPDGSDNPAGRQLNRRVEIYIPAF